VDHPTAGGVQREYAPAVLANRLRLDRRWGRPCLGYNLCLRPAPAAAAGFSAVQQPLLAAEPSLLRVPEQALHANVSWLLPVHREFGRPKDELWRRHGAGWLAIVGSALAAAAVPYPLRYRHLVATDAAIIAVADEPNFISALRRELATALPVPGGLSAGQLVHTTLFRYLEPLRDPGSLLARLAAAEFLVTVDVPELLVVRERVFPSLDYEVIRRLPTGAAGGPS
jgi:hypothetical protein